MAPSRTGTASQVDAGAGSGSTSVTVPADATGAVAFWGHWNSDQGSYLDTLTLGGLDFFDFVSQLAEGWTAGDTGQGVAFLNALPGTGSQTLAWAWDNPSDARDEGGELVIVWVKDHNTAGPVRDAEVDTEQSFNVPSVTIDTETTDLVIAFAQAYDPVADPSLDGTVFIDNAVLNSQSYDVSQVTPSAGTTTVTMTSVSYSSLAAISLPAADSAETIVWIPIATGGDDAAGEYSDAAGNWPPDGGTWVDYQGDSGLGVFKTDKDLTEGSRGELTYLRFNTSPAIPDDATVTGATVRLHVNEKTDANNTSLVGDYYDFGGGATTDSDWIETASPSIFSAADLGTIVVGDRNSFDLTDLTGINKTGYTGIRLTISQYTPLFNHDSVGFIAYEHANLQEPRLRVAYTVEEAAEATFVVPMRMI